MKLEQRKPPLEPISEDPDPEALHLRGTPVRCPFCHDRIAVDREAWAVCKACLARHHVGCWREGGEVCASCGAVAAFYETFRTSSGTHEVVRRWNGTWTWFLVLMGALALFTLYVITLTPIQPDEFGPTGPPDPIAAPATDPGPDR